MKNMSFDNKHHGKRERVIGNDINIGKTNCLLVLQIVDVFISRLLLCEGSSVVISTFGNVYRWLTFTMMETKWNKYATVPLETTETNMNKLHDMEWKHYEGSFKNRHHLPFFSRRFLFLFLSSPLSLSLSLILIWFVFFCSELSVIEM